MNEILKFIGIIILIILGLTGGVALFYIWIIYVITPLLDWIESWSHK